MVLYPETQKPAWEELDAVVGREHPPRWEHCEKMTYLLATVRETLRWRPTLPCGLMHVASEVCLAVRWGGEGRDAGADRVERAG